MSTQRSHIIKQILFLICFGLGILSYAQIKVNINETSTLSVNELATSADYVWELYDQIPTDFAKTRGNCPIEKAEFIGGNIGHEVKVKWLKSGVYFYKVTAKNSCTNNLKIGKVIVESTKPNKPLIKYIYDCDNGVTKLIAKNTTGTLKWSTGETSSEIIVSHKGAYSLTQTVNGVESDATEIFITNPFIPEKPDIRDVPTTIFVDEEVDLSAAACYEGAIHWYSDKDLTQEISETILRLKKKSSYYAVCITDEGCKSEISKLILVVHYKDDEWDKLYKTLNKKIYNLISPNRDGANDYFNLSNLKEYCDKYNKTLNVEVFNRWGNLVFKQDDYLKSTNKFRGRASDARSVLDPSQNLVSGTYFYMIKVEGKQPLTGWIYVQFD